MSTVLLRNGRIIDGTGDPGFDGHVLIDGDCIKAVLKGNDRVPQADVSVDTSGLAIAPGFIDVHSHLEGLLARSDHACHMKCQLEQGITTIVGGNCGFSPAPVAAEPLRSFNSCELGNGGLGVPLTYDWRTTGEFLNRVEQAGPAINLALLVGHGTLRRATARTRRGPMKPDELRDCLSAVERSLDEGACGLSFGLGYDPGLYSPDEEVEAFTRIAAMKRKPVTVHLRTYARRSAVYPLSYRRPHNVRALREMIDIARRAGAALQVSHIVPLFRGSWPTAGECLQAVEDAHREGVDIAMDAVPYPFLNGIIASCLQPWFQARIPQVYRSRMARMYHAFEMAIAFRLFHASAGDIRLMDAVIDGYEDAGGLALVEIARRRKASPWEVVLQLSERSHEQAAIIVHNLTGDEKHTSHIEAVLSHRLCLIGSDALVRSAGYPNPAAFGTFPKVLGHFGRDRGLLSLEEAVRKMTSAGAERFGLRDRGVLAPGKAADIVVFDPRTISEGTPTAEAPAARPAGIRHVFLNGAHVVTDGAHVESMRAGRVLRT